MQHTSKFFYAAALAGGGAIFELATVLTRIQFPIVNSFGECFDETLDGHGLTFLGVDLLVGNTDHGPN